MSPVVEFFGGPWDGRMLEVERLSPIAVPMISRPGMKFSGNDSETVVVQHGRYECRGDWRIWPFRYDYRWMAP